MVVFECFIGYIFDFEDVLSFKSYADGKISWIDITVIIRSFCSKYKELFQAKQRFVLQTCSFIQMME